MKVGKADALAGEFIQIRGLDSGIPGAAQVAIPLIVRKNEKDIGLRCTET